MGSPWDPVRPPCGPCEAWGALGAFWGAPETPEAFARPLESPWEPLGNPGGPWTAPGSLWETLEAPERPMEPLGSLGNLVRLLRGPVSKGKGGEEKGGVGWKKGEVEEGDEEDGTRRTTKTRREG